MSVNPVDSAQGRLLSVAVGGTFSVDSSRNNRVVYTTASPGLISVSGAFPAGSYTKTAWVLWPSTEFPSGQYPHILSGSDGTFSHLFWHPTGQGMCATNTSSADFFSGIVNANGYAPGVWTHYACVFDSATNVITLYVNAVSTETKAVDANPGIAAGSSPQLFIGAFQQAEVYFVGSMDDVRLYSRALSQSEIAAIMAST